MTAFFTKNGVALGTAFTDLKGFPLYPTVGLRTPGEVVEANFGASKFKFGIEHFYKEEKSRLWSAMNGLPMPPVVVSSSPTTNATINQNSVQEKEKGASSKRAASIAPASPNDLILQYLIHHGFAETAQEFYASAYSGTQTATIPPSSTTLQPPVVQTESYIPIEHLCLEDHTHMLDRSRIRDAILSGKLDIATNMVSALFPKAWVVDREVGFRVRLRKFIEVVREALPPCSKADGRSSNCSQSNGTHNSNIMDSSVGDGSDDNVACGESMDVDDSILASSSSAATHTSDISVLENTKDQQQTASRPEIPRSTSGKWEDVLRLGQELQSEFGESGDENRIAALQEAYSLVAYPNLYQSPVAHLLDPAGRVPVANALNSAILASLNQPRVPALESMYRQAHVVTDLLVQAGNGAAAFIAVDKDCL
ncbi:hypothetical protein SeLEV6574_g00207 [Synchytrium endobioticum]|nr:hypothetical protein SeLEV6574_g00207 [Synchytrium endobioticum]